MEDESWSTKLSTMDITTGKSLFRDYKKSAVGEKRKGTAINYEALKKERISEMTVRARDPRQSLVGDPQTGIVGIIPNYKSLKNTHRESVAPFLSPYKNHSKDSRPASGTSN